MFLPNVPTCAYCETRGQTLSGSTCRVGKTYVLHKPSSHESSTPYSNLFRISELEVLNWSLKTPGQDIMYIISIFTKLINQPQIPQIIASDTNINQEISLYNKKIPFSIKIGGTPKFFIFTFQNITQNSESNKSLPPKNPPALMKNLDPMQNKWITSPTWWHMNGYTLIQGPQRTRKRNWSDGFTNKDGTQADKAANGSKDKLFFCLSFIAMASPAVTTLPANLSNKYIVKNCRTRCKIFVIYIRLLNLINYVWNNSRKMNKYETWN